VCRTTLFIFLDESGNLDFSRTGSKFWSLTAFCTFHPRKGKGSFLDLLYTLADDGIGQECLHASEDKQTVRDQVFALMNGLADEHEIHCVIAEKRKANPSTYIRKRVKNQQIKTEKAPAPFYRIICKALLKYVFGCARFNGATKIVIVLSSLFTKDKHDNIRGALTAELKAATKSKFHIYFHPNKADLNSQIADYCGWAIFRKWELGDPRSYDLIRTKIHNEFDVFRRGTSTYIENTKGRSYKPLPLADPSTYPKKNPGVLFSGREPFNYSLRE